MISMKKQPPYKIWQLLFGKFYLLFVFLGIRFARNVYAATTKPTNIATLVNVLFVHHCGFPSMNQSNLLRIDWNG